MAEIIDGAAISQAMRRLSAIGEYLILDDINDLGKIDHLHHYLVGLLLFFLGIGGELTGKALEVMNSLCPPATTPIPMQEPPSLSSPSYDIATPESSERPFYVAGERSDVPEGESDYEYSLRKPSIF